MTQGAKLGKKSKAASGGRLSKKMIGKVSKGKKVVKPKRAKVATKLNASRRMTGAITRNIEKQMGHAVQKNGGSLGLLKGVAQASRDDTHKAKNDRLEAKANGTKVKKTAPAEFRAGEVRAEDKAPRFNPKRRFKL
jgi:type IV secretory pathway TrbL component